MEFAIAYPAKLDAWKDVVLAEDHGFSHAWFYDSQMLYSDVYVCMALAAEKTYTRGHGLSYSPTDVSRTGQSKPTLSLPAYLSYWTMLNKLE